MIDRVFDSRAIKWLNRVLFKRYFEEGKGIQSEKDDNGDWRTGWVDHSWDDASEAERRNER